MVKSRWNAIRGILATMSACRFKEFMSECIYLPDPVLRRNISRVFLRVRSPEHTVDEALRRVQNPPGGQALILRRRERGGDPKLMTSLFEVVNVPWIEVGCRWIPGGNREKDDIDEIRRVLFCECKFIG